MLVSKALLSNHGSLNEIHFRGSGFMSSSWLLTVFGPDNSSPFWLQGHMCLRGESGETSASAQF